MSTPALRLALPCPKCKAKATEPCRRMDGGVASRPHVNRTPLAPCGTYGGYQRHRKANEPACDGCHEAHRRYVAEYRRANPDVRERDIDLLRARRRATARLIALRRDDFDRLLAEEVGAA